jgi:hypothetical protein
MIALQKALLAYLKSQSGLQARLGTPARIYDELPSEPVTPYVALGRAQVRNIGGVGGAVDEQLLTLHCVSRFGGTEEVKAIVEALRTALQDAVLILEAGQVVSISVVFVDVFRAADLRSIYGVMRVRIVTE